jgi:ABC-2 type transport system permease protein
MAVFHVAIHGSWPGFILCNAAIALFAGSLGLFVAAIGRTPDATRAISIFVVLIMVMLGGAWIPAFLFPEWLQKATLLLPTRWAVDGLTAMTWRGLPFSAALNSAAVLLGYALLLGAIALKSFHWEMD